MLVINNLKSWVSKQITYQANDMIINLKSFLIAKCLLTCEGIFTVVWNTTKLNSKDTLVSQWLVKHRAYSMFSIAPLSPLSWGSTYEVQIKLQENILTSKNGTHHLQLRLFCIWCFIKTLTKTFSSEFPNLS